MDVEKVVRALVQALTGVFESVFCGGDFRVERGVASVKRVFPAHFLYLVPELWVDIKFAVKGCRRRGGSNTGLRRNVSGFQR